MDILGLTGEMLWSFPKINQNLVQYQAVWALQSLAIFDNFEGNWG